MVALVVWWGASAHFAIPLVWVGGVVAAAALVHGPKLFVAATTPPGRGPSPVVYVLAVGCVAVAVVRFERRYRTKLAKVPELNEYLRTALAPAPMALHARRRRDGRRAAALVLRDRSASPTTAWWGSTGASRSTAGPRPRYQLNALCWALSAVRRELRAERARAGGSRALTKLVEKHTDLRVWGYWRTLNLLGNFDPNPDPIARDNIMFSAFLGDVLNIFEAATGSTRFDEPGSLTFVWKDGRTFEYDHHTHRRRGGAQLRAQQAGVLPVRTRLVVHRVQRDGRAEPPRARHHARHRPVGPRAAPVRATLDDEYYTPDGSYAHIRSNHVGLSWDTGEVPGGHYFAQGSHRFADILPEPRGACGRARSARRGEARRALGDGAGRTAGYGAAARAGAPPRRGAARSASGTASSAARA